MELTLVLGDPAIDKSAAVHRAMARLNLHPSTVRMFDLDEVADPDADRHRVPAYWKRYQTGRERWGALRRRLGREDVAHAVILCSAFQRDAAGFELAFPIDILRDLAARTRRSGGQVALVILIDEAFGPDRTAPDVISVALARRHLEITFAQYLAAQLSLPAKPFCFCANHPSQNFAQVLARQPARTLYLCHPINAFRRDPRHPDRAALDAFRSRLATFPFILFDPLGIDEEAIISRLAGRHGEDEIVIAPDDRWKPPSATTILAIPPAFTAGGGGIRIFPRPSPSIAARCKAQVPERDFYWINCSDLVVAWRPFLGGSHHAGVLSEVQHAIHNGVPVLAYSPAEDGTERPSPFAAMLSTYASLDEVFERLTAFANKPVSSDNEVAMEKPLPKFCDHTSVGVLIYNEHNELLLIERGTFPFGMAVPAGHVDDHPSYEEAAIAEVREEVGLEVSNLKLVAEGRRENPCRRTNGKWHYWKIFEASATGEVKLSARETRSAEWCGPERLAELGLVSSARAQASPPLERVWLDWFYELEILKEPDGDDQGVGQ